MSNDGRSQDERDRRAGARAFDESLKGGNPTERAFFRNLGGRDRRPEPPAVENDDVGIDGL
jgi:hypothetical protein